MRLFAPVVLGNLCLVRVCLADALYDFAYLHDLISTASSNILGSVIPINTTGNATTPHNATNYIAHSTIFPTAATLANLTIAIENSQASCDANDTAFVNGHPRNVTDAAYLNYMDTILSLSQALTARGRAWHSDWNQPVWSGIQALATAIHTYGSDMASLNLTTTRSTIRTITAGSSLFNAQNAWSMSGWLPGKKSRRTQLRQNQ